MKKVIGIIIGILGGSAALHAQQDAMFTHYMYNTQAVNPAYAGSRQALTITALHRSQWVSFPGAPTTQTLTLHTPVRRESIGLGLSVMNDKIGPVSTASMYVDFAYRIKLNERNDRLSFGLKGGFNLRQAKLSTLETEQASDPIFGNISGQFMPNFGFGAYYQAQRFYLGVSTPKLLQNKYTTISGGEQGAEQRHYFLIGGAMVKMNTDFEFRPTALVKMTPGAPVEADITAMFIYQQKMQAGVMYRTGDAAGLLIGMNALENLTIGYSFDWSFTNTTFRYNGGSHELMLRYDLVYKNRYKIKSPRYF